MTRNTPSYRDKGRAMFLSALMVLSIVAMSVTLSGAAVAADHDASVNASDLNGEEYWEGQTVQVDVTGVDDIENIDDISVREVTDRDNEGNPISTSSARTSTVNEDNGQYYINIRTDRLNGVADYVLRADGEFLNTDGTEFEQSTGDEMTEFEVNEQDLDVEFQDDDGDEVDTINADDETSLLVETRRGGEFDLEAGAEVDGDELDEDDIDEIFEEDGADDGVISDVRDLDELDANFTDQDLGNYTFDFEVVDTGVETQANITVEEAVGDNLEFAEDNYEDEQGDIVDFQIDVEDFDEFYLDLEEEDVDDPYAINATVNNIDYDELDGDDLELQFNTVQAGFGDGANEGEDDSVQNVLTSDDADVMINDVELPSGFDYDDGDRIAAGDYETQLYEEDFMDDSDVDEVDAAFIVLEERSNEDLTNWIAPGDTEFEDMDVDELVDNSTERDTIAEDDLLVAQVEASGLEGTLTDTSDIEDNGFDNVDGVNFQVEDTDEPRFGEPDSVSLSSDYLNYVDDLENNQFFVVVETEQLDVIEADETWESNFTLTESFAYADDDEDMKEEFDVEERDMEITGDFDADDVLNVPASEEATLSADTNVAPGTEAQFRLRFDTSVDRETVEVGDDNEVTLEHDLSDREEGDEFTLRVRDQFAGSDNQDIVDAVVGEAEEPPEPVSWDVDVDPAAPEDGDDVTVTVEATNDGDDDEERDYEFVFDGDTQLEDTWTIESGESASDSFTVEEAPAGDYDWELLVDGESEIADTLTVSEMDPDDDEVDDDEVDDDEVDDEADDDGTPGFGAAVAAIALLAAAMLALRRQD